VASFACLAGGGTVVASITSGACHHPFTRNIEARCSQAQGPLVSLQTTLCLENPLRGGGILQELFRRSHWSSDQFPAAIRTDAMQDLRGAGAAKRALKRADHGFHGMRGQIFVTTLTVRA